MKTIKEVKDWIDAEIADIDETMAMLSSSDSIARVREAEKIVAYAKLLCAIEQREE